MTFIPPGSSGFHFPPPVSGSAGQALVLYPSDTDLTTESPWALIDRHIESLATIVVRAPHPGEMGFEVMARLRSTLEYRFELLFGRYHLPDIDGSGEAERLALLQALWQGANLA